MNRIAWSTILLFALASESSAQLQIQHQTIDAVVELPLGYAERYPLLMKSDPAIPPLEKKVTFDQRFLDLWLEALSSDDSDRRQLAAEAILDAHQRGIEQLERAIDPLISAFENSREMLNRQATAAALVELDARKAADCFFGHASEARVPVAKIIELALARWDDSRLVSVWTERLSDSYADRARKRLAIQCLGIVKDKAAFTELTRIVKSRYGAPTVRLESAAALVHIAGDRNVETSSFLMSRSAGSLLDRILAARLLESSDGDDVVNMLLQICNDPDSSVVAIAAQRLWAISPKATNSISKQLVASPNANVRLIGIKSLAVEPEEAEIQLLADLLSDHDPNNRTSARQLLTKYATSRFGSLIRQRITDILKDAKKVSEDWRQVEQAIIYLAENNLKADAILLPKFLASQRVRVYLTSAWALKELANAATFPECLDYLVKKYGETKYNPASDESPVSIPPNEDQQITHLCEMFGINKYEDSAVRLKEFIPKTQRFRGENAREAAIWALGHIYQGRPQVKLASDLKDRIEDPSVVDPETLMVQGMCAVTIARMGNKEQLPAIEQYDARVDTPEGYCKAWAIEKFTGKPIPKRLTLTSREQGWFLQAVGRSEGKETEDK